MSAPLLSRDWYTIEPSTYGGFNVYVHGTYGRGSVLEGRSGRSYMGNFDTVEAAKRAFPEAEESGCTRHTIDPDPGPNPPSWFDPSVAGERWDDD